MIGGIGQENDFIKLFSQVLVGQEYIFPKNPLEDLSNFMYKVFVEYDSKSKIVKNLIIEIEE